MKKKQWISAILISALLAVLLFYVLGWLFMPPRQDYGCTWSRYRKEPENSIDVLFFGSSLAYCNIAPAVIWEDTGITSYLMAGPEQTIPFTYSYIKEACRTQSPKMIAIEITGMFYKQYCSYSKVNAGYMPWTENRIESIFSAAEPELRAGLLFPLYDYHSRWKDISLSDIKTRLIPTIDPHAGYTFLAQSAPQGDAIYQNYSAETENYARNKMYLKKIHDFCLEQDIQLMLFLTPTKGLIPGSALSVLKQDIADLDDVIFVDFNDDIETLNINDGTDWYDFLHFNFRGAEKFSRYFADYLSLSITPTSLQQENHLLWQSRVDAFHAQKLESLSS